MKKCLIWGMGHCFFDAALAIKYHESRKNLKIVGITSNMMSYKEFYGYKFIPKTEIKKLNIDFIILLADGKAYNEIYAEILELGFNTNQIIKLSVIKQPTFDINKYSAILKEKPTILTNNCWGGITYNRLGIQFNTPTINMFFEDGDYIKFLKRPKHYMEQELEFDSIGVVKRTQKKYPVAKCDDILLRFNHSDDFDEAKESWDRRKKRINWDNIMVVMYTLVPEFEKEFNKLPYDKKVCFVPYETKQKHSLYIPFIKDLNYELCDFWRIVNGLALNTLYYYDVFDLIQKGKIKQVVKF